MARFGVFFVFLKWITVPAAVIYLLIQQNYISAVVALLWPIFLAPYLGSFIGGTKIGKIQEMFMAQLGYSEKQPPESGVNDDTHQGDSQRAARYRKAAEQGDAEAQYNHGAVPIQTKIVRRLSPEEEELAQKREELELLQNQLAERELFLANLRAELAALEGRYLREVGVLYAELDDWNARIAESVAEQKGTEEARAAATQARSQAEESHAAAHGEAAEPGEFSPSPELKSLYREAAKLVHPDLATDDADRQRRELLMKEANRAYQEGDADALRRIIEEYESSPESVKGAGVGADLVRVIRQIKQVRVRLAQIELEIASLTDSEIAKLKAKAEEASKQGRDLLAEMAENVKRRVEAASGRYESRSMSATP
jgi:peptidoglycan hydrolase CwlO-like protein